MKKEDIIKEYYEDLDIDNLLIVGLSDDRGFNFQKNLLLVLKEALESSEYDISVIDAFSMFFNKNRHIDYYLKHNVSTRELDLMKIFSTKNEINHAIGDNFISKKIGSLGSKLIKSGNYKNLYISDAIKEHKEPIIVYSSGINDIMYNTYINPFSAKKLYKKQRDRYDYSVSLVTGQNKDKTMNTIMDSHKKNFENILGLNSKSKICSLGAYLYNDPKKYDEVFHEFVLYYNEKLEDLCIKYGVNYVDTRFIENTDYRNAMYTYLKPMTYFLANRILQELSKCINKDINIKVPKFNYDNLGSNGVLQDMKDYKNYLLENDINKYSRVCEELDREEEVFKEIIKVR